MCVERLSLNGFWPQSLAGESYTLRCVNLKALCRHIFIACSLCSWVSIRVSTGSRWHTGNEMMWGGCVYNETTSKSVGVEATGMELELVVQQQPKVFSSADLRHKGKKLSCKLEGRARGQWTSTERPNQLEVTLSTGSRGISTLSIICLSFYYSAESSTSKSSRSQVA